MAFNPFFSYVEKYLSHLLCSNGRLNNELSNYGNMSQSGKVDLLNKHMTNITNDYQSLTGRPVDDTLKAEASDILRNFLESFPKFNKNANIKDIHSLVTREKLYSTRQLKTLKSEVLRIHANLFGISVYENHERLNQKFDSGEPAALSEFLDCAEASEDELREYLNDIELWKGFADIENVEPDEIPETIIDKTFEILGEKAEEKVDELIDNAEKLTRRVLIKKIDDLLQIASAPVERSARGERSAIAAEAMAFLNPSFDLRAEFRNHAAFMLLMLDLYPYRTAKVSTVEAKTRLAEILQKSALGNSDVLFINDLYRHLRDSIATFIEEKCEKYLSLDKKPGQYDTAAVHFLLNARVKEVELLDKIISANSILGESINSTINSRIIASFIEPMLHQNYLIDMPLVDELVKRYQGHPGISKLAVCKEINLIKGADSLKSNPLDFLKRIRPAGELECFAYSSPDTNMPMIRAINNMHNIGAQLVFAAAAAKHLTSSGLEDAVNQMAKLKNLDDLFKYVKEKWADGDLNVVSSLRRLVPDLSSVKQVIHKKWKTNLLYQNEIAEVVQKGCGDLGQFNLTQEGALTQSELLCVMDILLLSAELSVLDLDTKAVKKALIKLRDEAGMSKADLASIASDVITPDIKERLEQLANMNQTGSFNNNRPTL